MTNTDLTLKHNWNLPKQQVRDKIQRLQEEVQKLPQVETPIQEYWSEGTYGREMFIPKGTCLVGEIHATEWIIVVSRGKIKIVSDEGVKIIDATEKPVTFVSPAGAKRAGYALEDTWWTGFRFVGDLDTTDAIRKAHLVGSYKELEDKLCGE